MSDTTELDFVQDLRAAFGFVEITKTKRKYVRKTDHLFKFDAARAEEMLELRYGQKWTLNKIGIKFGVSRERVRQIIGNTRFTGSSRVTPKKARRVIQVEEARDAISPDKTNQEVATETGFSKVFISLIRAGTRHAVPAGLTSEAMKTEEMVSKLLLENGIENKLMPNHHPYDIELADGRRVEVKSRVATIQRTPSGKENYHFQLTKNSTVHERAEFFILVSPYDIFVIPSCQIKAKTKAIAFCYPKQSGSNRRVSKFWQYRDRFDLLK